MNLFRFQDFSIDPTRRQVVRSGMPVAMSVKAFDLLLYMAQHPGQPLLKEELLGALWPHSTVEESNLTHAVYQLRKALAASGGDGPDPILTLPGRGYQFAATVEIAPDTQPAPPQVATDALAATAAAAPAKPFSRRWVGLYGVLAVTLMALGMAFLIFRPLSMLRVAATVQLTDDGVRKTLAVSPSHVVDDGTELHFIENEDNRSLLAKVSRSGGAVESRPAPVADANMVDYSARHRSLLLGSIWKTGDNNPILIQPLDGSPARQIGELAGHDAAFSPDETMIAIARGRFLYVAKADGSDLHRIASAEGIIFYPRWSPDGRRLRFSVNHADNEDNLWEVRANGEGLQQLFVGTPYEKQVCCGSWTADGRNFFYVVKTTVTQNIWVLPERSPFNLWQGAAQPYPLTAGQNNLWQPPAPSPDGRSVWAIGSHVRGELMTVNRTNHQLQPFLSGISAEGVNYSPDGQWITYTSYPEGVLWVSRADGSQKRQLGPPNMLARFPQWSPDGRNIAFTATTAGSAWRIYIVPAAGGVAKPLLEDAISQGVPSWSPDSKYLSFGRLLDYGTTRNPDLTIEIYDLDRHTHTTLHGSEGLWTARWSPDGRFLSAVTQDSRTLRLYDFKTQQWSDLADVGVNDVIWSRDSKSLYFDTTYGGDAALYRVALDTRRLERWADLHGLHRGGFYSPWLGITRDGDPLLLKDTSIEEVYRLDLTATK